MSIPAVLAPVFVLIALTFFLNFWMARLRISDVSGRTVHTRDIALREPNWPTRTTQIGNAYHNQLEHPVLFYVLVAFALITRQADFLFVMMSWLFVVFRVLHAYVFVTTNLVSRRFQVFSVAAVILLLMWIIFAVRILTAGL
jgi:hypothetical protein